MADTYSFEIEQGASFTYAVTLFDEQQTPINLTDAVIQSYGRVAFTDVTSSFAFTSSLVDPTNGKFTLSLHPSSSAAITANVYKYDVRVILATGEVIKPYSGEITVNPAVTR